MKWKKSLIALCLSSYIGVAVASSTSEKIEPLNEIELKQRWTQEWASTQQEKGNIRTAQRANFLQLTALLDSGKLTSPVLALANRLRSTLEGYPLIEEADWALMKAKMRAKSVSDEELAQFIEKYPNTAKRNRVNQLPFETLYQQEDFKALVKYGEKVSPTTALNQYRLLSARYQLLMKEQPNLEGAEVGEQAVKSQQFFANKQALLDKFEQFWLSADGVISECQAVQAEWLKSVNIDEKIKQKALLLFQKGSKKGIADLIAQAQDETLKTWLQSVQALVNDPTNLQKFAENQPLDVANKTVVIETFPKFISTLSEEMDNPDFGRFQQWAEKWQLSNDEMNEWKTRFISRQFDNPDPIFQLWRDEQIKALKVDNLTERRLRMAILQKEKLDTWLELLSDEAKKKAEWRYWQAKSDPKQKTEQLSALAKERGFYPMLAAQTLGQSYQIEMLQAKPLNDEQREKWRFQLERITELRALERISQAKMVWSEMLQAVDFDEKLALGDFATRQNWYDLAVEATIQAKAWDYIPLRLPNAYSDWFDLNLVDKPVGKSFAMAIARQESAWNPQVKSHANAIGLMQMLPSTAQKTASDNQLPFTGERDLLEPFRNIMLGTTHLAELNAKYPNNRVLIAAAYNAGASRVERWLKRAGDRLELDEFIASIPFLETRGYVQNVLAYDYYYQILQGVKTPVMFNPEEVERKY